MESAKIVKGRRVKLGLFLFISCFSFHAYSACLQNFNTYGPVYAPLVQQRTDAFMEEILKENCEVVHFQEAWNSPQISRIEQWLDVSYLAYSPNKGSRNGLMSLSRWDISKTQYRKFRYNTDGGILDGGRELVGVEKGFAVQWLSTPGGDMAFVNLHLHPTSKAVRLAQIFELIKWRMTTLGTPVVITGDFNMGPYSLEKALVIKALQVKDVVDLHLREYPKGFCTYCGHNPLSWTSKDKILDYIFISDEAPIQIRKVEVNLKGTLDFPYSDHYGIKLTWDFVQRSPAPRDLLAEAQNLAKVFQSVLPVISQKYTKSSEIYRTLGLWNQQLVRQEGAFWAYFSGSGDQNPPQWWAQSSGIVE